MADGFPGETDSLFQAGGVVPAEVVEAGYIHELARSAVRLGSVEDQLATEAKDCRYSFRQFADGCVFARADVDEGRSIWREERVVAVLIEVHQEETGLG